MLTKRDLLRSVAATSAIGLAAKSGPVLAQASADRPGFFKAKAEAGFIYGLPIVMNYATCTRSPLIAIRGSLRPRSIRSRTSRASSPRRHGNRDAEQRHAVLHDSGWTCGRSRLSCRSRQSIQKRYYSVIFSTAIPTTTAISAPVPPEAKPAITWWQGRIGKATVPPGIKKMFRSEYTIFACGISHPAFRPGRHRQRQRRSRPATRRSRSRAT